jgi:thioredoxin 1
MSDREHDGGEPSSAIPYVAPASLRALLRESTLPVLVSFDSPPLEAVMPDLGALASTFAGQLRVLRVNVVNAPELAEAFKVRSIPTLLLFKDGRPIDFVVGTVPTRFVAGTVGRVLGILPNEGGTWTRGQGCGLTRRNGQERSRGDRGDPARDWWIALGARRARSLRPRCLAGRRPVSSVGPCPQS